MPPPELIITAGGENVPPVPIEEAVMRELPIVSCAMLIGDQRKFLSMLLTLKVRLGSSQAAPASRDLALEKPERMARRQGVPPAPRGAVTGVLLRHVQPVRHGAAALCPEQVPGLPAVGVTGLRSLS